MRYIPETLALVFALCVASLPAMAQPLPGVVVAAESWDVAAPVDGKIAKLHFREGMIVQEGDLLMSLDNRIKKIEVEIAAAKVSQVEAELVQRSEVLERQLELMDRDAVSVATLSEAKHAVELAKTDVLLARLELDMARATLAAHDVHAAISGVISAPRLHEGSNFSVAESGSVAVVHRLDPIHVRVRLNKDRVLRRLLSGEYDIDDVRALRLSMSLSNGAVYPLQGKVVGVGFELDETTGDGSVLLSFPNPKGVLRPGLSVIIGMAED